MAPRFGGTWTEITRRPRQRFPENEKAPGPGTRGQDGGLEGRQNGGSADVEGDAAVGSLLGADNTGQFNLLSFKLLRERTVGDDSGLDHAGFV